MAKRSRIKFLESNGKRWSYCYSNNPESCRKHAHSSSKKLAELVKKNDWDIISINEKTVIHEDVNGETITYFDYAVAEAERSKDSPFECIDCGLNTMYAGEYYMVNDAIWDAHVGSGGMLCIGCLENRMGRILNSNDFTSAPINSINQMKSERLINRLNR